MRGKFLCQSQEKVDEEIRALERRLCALRTSRNSFAYINQLPAELLTEIFLWTQAPYIERDPSHIIKWIRVTHVSKHWRSLAFSSTVLWTTIPTHNPAYAQLASQLSFPVPVSIVRGAPDVETPDTEALEVFVSLLQRTRDVNATDYVGTFLFEALQNASSNLPYLQDVEFDEIGVHLSTKESPFPKSLKRVSLSNSPLEWSWLKFDQLTELHLRYCNNPEIAINSFLDHMSQIPRLSYLEIRWLLVSRQVERQNPSHQQRPVTLTLEHLIIEDDLVSVTKFLSCVQLTERFTLRVELDIDDETPDETFAFFQQIDRHLQPSQWVIRSASLIRPDMYYYTLSCFDQNTSTTPFLVIEGHEIPDEEVQLFLDGMQTLPFNKMQRLSTDAFADASEWEDCRFRTLESIQELVICDCDSSNAYINFSMVEMDAAGRSDNVNISFPALKRITLHDVEYRGDVGKKIKAIFTGRAEHAFRIEELTFKGGRIEEEGVKNLRTVVNKVILMKGNDQLPL
ncbi:hypothetical protein BDN72DRAFT_850212 [Pluteus cervinus]|uniref:Uncharacterized protein n=1 Tax=Pluteus cervinus TaxID=181527 RepID=A0ACD3A5A7_9AGAR|nr:hypothetical protein BDN72DRAFT_850212 [Pluteus cervinus]